MLGSNQNVYNTCLLILRTGGWELSLEGESDDEDHIVPESLLWLATKDGYDLWAENPIELLGLAAIHDFKRPEGPAKPYWWRVDGMDVYTEMLDKAFPDDDD